MTLPLWAAAVIALLGVLILAHELGHFLVAKLLGVKVLRFSLGFGPRLFGVKIGSTEYQISLFFLGGYLRLLGEDPSELVSDNEREQALFARPLWQRYAIVVAGPLFNLLLPIGIYFIHYIGQKTQLAPTIGTIIAGLPAAQAGLLPGDRVEAVDGHFVRSWEDLEEIISESPNKTLRFAIRRGNSAEERDVSPTVLQRKTPLNISETVGWIGVSPRFQLPEVGIVDLTSPAAQAGLRTFDYIISVNGAPVSHWAEFERAMQRAGASPLRITYLRGTHSILPFAHVEVQEPGSTVVIPQAVLDAAGGRHYQTGIEISELFVYSVEPGSPADRIGLRRGDQLLALDGQPILHWNILRQRLNSDPERLFHLTWDTPGGERREAYFKQELRSELDAYRQEEQRLVFGATNRFAWKTADPVPVHNRFFYAVGHAFTRTWEIVVFTTQGFFQIMRGEVSPQSLGGPITIGYAAGVAAEQGLAQYLWLMALLSINIGLINFLPIPILDGGLLMFFTIELFKRRPPSPRARAVATYFGIVVVVLLVAFALKNDVVRFLLPR